MAWYDDDEFDLGGFDPGGVGYDTGAFDIPSFDLSNIDLGGAGYDIGAFDLSGLDLGGLGYDTGAFDLSGLDLGGIGYDTGAFDLTGAGADLGGLGYDTAAFDLGDLGSFGADVGLVDTYDLGGVDFSSLSPDIKGDISTILTSDVVDASTLKDMGIDLGGGFTSEDYAKLQDAFGTVESNPYEGLGYSNEDIRALQEGTYSGPEQTLEQVKQQLGEDLYPMYEESLDTTKDYLASNAWKEILKTGTAVPGGGVLTTDKQGRTVIKYDDGTTKVIGGDTGITTEDLTKTTTKPTDKSWLEQLTGSKQNSALLMALLGGLLGLLGKGSYPKGPVGYKGGIPKYTATRGEAMAPTAGGRRPGGAGIPSLTGGVTYTAAAHGGLMGLKRGQYLDGATDGMADKIQTSIDGKQPARLSHGEFVVPADVVSHLGNGNSDAGADVLYDMMAKVRKARTGTPKQGKQINPRKYIPA